MLPALEERGIFMSKQFLMIPGFDPPLSQLGLRVVVCVSDDAYGFVDVKTTRTKGKKAANVTASVARPSAGSLVTPRRKVGKPVDRPTSSTIKLDLRTVALHAALQKKGKMLTVKAARKIAATMGITKRSAGQRIRALESAGRIVEVKSIGAREDHVLSIA